MKNRCNLEIMKDIIVTIMEGNNKKTNMMYGASLSYEQINQYLQILKDSDLIEEYIDDLRSTSYRITPKALEFKTMIVDAVGLIK